MLKWDKYKNLSSKLKEEYNWKFKDTPILNYTNIVYSIILCFMVATLFLAFVYVNINEGAYTKEEMRPLFKIAYISMSISLVVFFFWSMEFLIVAGIYLYKFNKWKKINKVM